MTLRTAPVVALVPTRSPGAGLSRMAPYLDDRRRRALGAAMLTDVVAALQASPVDRVVVAAAGRTAADAAAALGVEVFEDPPAADGLDDAVAAAVRRLPVAAAVLVVMADLPCLSAADVAAVLDVEASVVVAATEDGGTGGLLRRPPAGFPTAYGPDSAARHVRLAELAGRSAGLVRPPGFALDVDTWADLTRLDVGGVGAATGRVLRELTGDAGAAVG